MPYTSNTEIPLVAKEHLQIYYQKKSELFCEINTMGESLLKYIDTVNINSGFFFDIKSYNIDTNGRLTYTLKVKPGSSMSVDVLQSTINSNSLEDYFNKWVAQLRLHSLLDGPIKKVDLFLKQYEEEFYNDYRLVDEDADTNSYNYTTQLKIELFLEEINQRLEEEKNTENATEIEEIQKEVQGLRQKQTRLTKKQVYERLGKIVAAGRKAGLKIGKIILEAFAKGLADATVKYITNGGT